MKKPKLDRQEQQLKNLAKRVRELRKAKGYPNYEIFAYENNISRTQYGKYEKGENLKFLSLLQVLDGLDISLKEFFSEGFDDRVHDGKNDK